MTWLSEDFMFFDKKIEEDFGDWPQKEFEI